MKESTEHSTKKKTLKLTPVQDVVPSKKAAENKESLPQNGVTSGARLELKKVEFQEFKSQFENRKQDHIRIALSEESQARGLSGLDRIQLIHEALPELNLRDVRISTPFFGRTVPVPFFISSMTAGHGESSRINLILARAASRRGWPMGVGSQRRELTDGVAAREWKEIRRNCPDVILMGNLGLAEIIRFSLEDVERLVENLEADAFFVHCNPLQECLQKEGNPEYRGALKALESVARGLSIPVIVKETGCGFSRSTLHRLRNVGVAAVDVAGLGGTHWGRVEGYRQEPGDLLFESAQTFRDWGVSTLESVLWALEEDADYEVWASGGVRNGLDAAKLLALGANRVGIAQPLLAAAQEGEDAVDRLMERFEFELCVALFCTGHGHFQEWKQHKVWRWNSILETK